MTLYRSPDYKTNIETAGLSVQEQKLNRDFQDDNMAAVLNFQSERC